MDSIANMFTQLKNAGMAGKKETLVSYSKFNLAVLTILKEKGLIGNFSEEKQATHKFPSGIKVKLAFKNNQEMMFSNLRRISKPGQRVYIKAKEIGQRRRGKKDLLVSTPCGIMSGTSAQKKGLGGELIGEVI